MIANRPAQSELAGLITRNTNTTLRNSSLAGENAPLYYCVYTAAWLILPWLKARLDLLHGRYSSDR